jgi:hypothetical protein
MTQPGNKHMRSKVRHPEGTSTLVVTGCNNVEVPTERGVKQGPSNTIWRAGWLSSNIVDSDSKTHIMEGSCIYKFCERESYAVCTVQQGKIHKEAPLHLSSSLHFMSFFMSTHTVSITMKVPLKDAIKNSPR